MIQTLMTKIGSHWERRNSELFNGNKVYVWDGPEIFWKWIALNIMDVLNATELNT